MPPISGVSRVVIMVHENHTTDNYFRGLAPYGANVATGWPISPNPPARDQPHDRHAYFRWLTHASTGDQVQFDTDSVLRFYAYLALTGTFFENHCSGFGTNSTPNHLLVVGGQSPTLKNPSRTSPEPVWDMPSLPGLASDHGLDWRCYAGRTGYPFFFYRQLMGSPKITQSAHFAVDAAAGKLPQLSFLYHDSPLDEHPPADVTQGMTAIWQAVAAVVAAGQWHDTVFLLTWDDWGGYDDHVATPAVEYTPDNVQLAFGPRVPLLMFGGPVKAGIDSRWCSHVSIPKTAMQLLGLPAMGVDRLDHDQGLADRVDASVRNPPPPPVGGAITLPAPPNPPRPPAPLPAPPVAVPVPVPPI
ncbi:MAG: alkaline phosphatase family protein, partial [Actinomycetota bacterium]|nr:alkaline phosphatase family protein [Actinomycetota bacterium]